MSGRVEDGINEESELLKYFSKRYKMFGKQEQKDYLYPIADCVERQV